MYEYNATVKFAYDGDTFTLTVDLGLDVYKVIKVRLYGIDTPELKTGTAESKVAGHTAATYVQKYVGQQVRIKTIKDSTEKYGRFLANIYALDAKGVPAIESINDEMLRLGYAKPYFGGKKG